MMADFVAQLDANFVLALLMFLIFFLFGMLAAIADMIDRKIRERKTNRYFAQFHEPIGRVTDYRIISNGYQPRGHYDGPLNPPSGGTAVQSAKLVAKRLKTKGLDKEKGKR